MEKDLLIKKTAKLLGVHPCTLRNWEEKGLIMPPRDINGYRRYGVKELTHLKALAGFRRPGKNE